MREDLPFRLPTHLLDADTEIALARTIEAGVVAGAWPFESSGHGGLRTVGPVTAAEIALLVAEGRRAQREMVEANLRLVVMVARQAAIQSRLGVGDLFQEGCLGLLVAVQRFDHRRGCRFATYALHWIRAYVGAASASRLGDLNVPPSRAGALRSARALAEVVSQQLGRSIAIEELAAQLGRSTRWTEELLATREPVSLDGPDSTRLLETLSATESEDRDLASREQLVAGLIGALPAVEREVLVLRMGLDGEPPLSYVRVGARMQLTVGRVRRMEAAALERLRERCPQSARDLLSA